MSRIAAQHMQGADPNQKNHDGLTALHQCCIDGSLDMVTLLLENGANVNIKDRDLWTPLHAAATCGHFKIVSLLIKAGADLTAINGDGDMPHDIAEDEVMQQYLENELAKIGLTENEINHIRNSSHSSMLADINYVLSSGGDLNQPLDQGGTFLHVAIASCFNDIAYLLLREGASASVRDDDGWEPIHVAAYWGNEEALDLLSNQEDTDIRSTTDNGETPYDLCEDHEMKIHILQKISDVSRKYGSVKTYINPHPQPSIKKLKSCNESDVEMISHFDDYEETITDVLNFNIYADQTKSQETDKENIHDQNGSDVEEVQESLQDNSSKDHTSYTILNLEASEFSERRNSVKEAKHLAPVKRANSLERHQQPPYITNNIKDGNDDAHEKTTDNILDLITTLSAPQQPIITMEDDDDEIIGYPQGIANPLYVQENNYMRNMKDDKEVHVTDGNQKDIKTNHVLPTTPSKVQRPTETGQTTLQVMKHSKPRAPTPPQDQRHQSPETFIPRNEPEVHNDTKYLSRQNATSSLKTQDFTEMNNNMLGKGSLINTTLMDLKKRRQEARLMQRVNLEADSKATLTKSTFYNECETYDPPPSPTMIRYHFKMSEEEFNGQQIIRVRKCIIM
ncbi:protein phosphatase 1 regulatory subunit 12A-like isoform X2 [Macrobrachium nipponense]|uniref:protein phosphatase 1 regulatory subunit 12A-like isoform X2 n=1 Tax=Macrobrachium nipponense TaxID=159736 RepID=UPI0030C892EE